MPDEKDIMEAVFDRIHEQIMDYIENGKIKFNKPTKESIVKARIVIRGLQKQAKSIKKQLARNAYDDLGISHSMLFFRLIFQKNQKKDDSRRSDGTS